MPHVNKKFRSLRIFLHTSISRSLENSDMNKKPLSFRSTLLFILFSNKITPNFFTCSISRFKIHSNKIDLKKGLLQYSSSSRKKTAPRNNSNSLNCKKLTPLRAKNDVTHAFQLKLHERINKKWL